MQIHDIFQGEHMKAEQLAKLRQSVWVADAVDVDPTDTRTPAVK